jgi:predicted tellurium resistance membrane protein TerC
MEWISSPEAWISLVTLTTLEVVLGIDNIIFIAILADRLPEGQRARARRLGLGLAVGSRILLLLSIVWIMRLTEPLFGVLGREFSGRDLILMVGGVFLLAKSTREIHHKLEGEDEHGTVRAQVTFVSVIVQIMLLDVIFSLDSVITAVGMVNDLPIMVAAIVIAMGVMLFAMEPVNGFIESHPSVKILALAFLILIGVILVADGLGQHVPKGYIYFAMAFSLGVELLNIRYHRRPRARAS